ncbi:MAG: threonine synthase, partial [Candidatus Thermofonsia Clade 1 bacterium]
MCYDYPALRHAVQPDQLSGWSMWRYAPLLPVSDSTYFPPLHVGWTPLIAA